MKDYLKEAYERERKFVENAKIEDLIVKPGKYFPKEGLGEHGPTQKEETLIILKHLSEKTKNYRKKEKIKELIEEVKKGKYCANFKQAHLRQSHLEFLSN